MSCRRFQAQINFKRHLKTFFVQNRMSKSMLPKFLFNTKPSFIKIFHFSQKLREINGCKLNDWIHEKISFTVTLWKTLYGYFRNLLSRKKNFVKWLYLFFNCFHEKRYKISKNCYPSKSSAYVRMIAFRRCHHKNFLDIF